MEVPGEVEVNYLLEEFLRQYNVFDGNCKPSAIGNKQVLLLFGTSKAGKSTFMARLRSALSPSEFLSALPTIENQKKEIEGFLIGKGVNSTTVAPKISSLTNGVLVCDMPGLKDTHPNYKAIISILHKCLFRRVSNAKMLIVIDIQILSSNPTGITADYCSELKSLFGEHFDKYLDSCYFILTHGDTVVDPLAITNKIPSMALQLLKSKNYDSGAFFGRMEDNHFVVNYNTTRVDEILVKISEWMQDGNSMNPQNFVHDTLISTANIINRHCVSLLRNRIDDEQRSTFLSSIKTEISEIQSSNIKNVARVSKEVESLEAAILIKKDNLAETERRLEQLIPLIEISETAKREADAEVVSCLNNLQQAKLVLTNVATIEVVRLTSCAVESSGILGGSYKHQIRANVKKHPCDSVMYGAVVCTNPEVADSIFRIMSESDNFNVLFNETDASVCYNNMVSTRAVDSDIDIRSTTSAFTVQVKMSGPFEVLLAYPMNLSSSPSLIRFRDIQQRKWKKATEDSKNASDKCSALSKDRGATVTLLGQVRTALSSLEAALDEKRNLMKDISAEYIAVLNGIGKRVNARLVLLQNITKGVDATINNMKSTSNILRENSLEYSMNEAMREYEGLMETSLNGVETVSRLINESLNQLCFV